MNPASISVEKSLLARSEVPVIDVRSPAEFSKGHILGSTNIPLFSDEERAVVGTKYVREGRLPSVEAGLEIVGPKLSHFVRELTSIAKGKHIIVYCWRGGMRSASMGWLFSLAGFNVSILAGGYKAYRHHAQNLIAQPMRMRILGGMTGSGKTEILGELKKQGEQTVDLEGMANHKGSAFGGIGQERQPTAEHFENLLFEALLKLDLSRPIWVEDESRGIGSVFIPDAFHRQMRLSPVFAIEIPLAERVSRLAKEYALFDKKLLVESVAKISKRLGYDNAQRIIGYIHEDRFDLAIAASLQYYDKAYRFGLENKPEKPRVFSFARFSVSEIAATLMKDSG